MIARIPQEVQDAANTLIRICVNKNVSLSGFAFAFSLDSGPFIFHFSNLTEQKLENVHQIHDHLFELINSNPDQIQHKLIRQNDA